MTELSLIVAIGHGSLASEPFYKFVAFNVSAGYKMLKGKCFRSKDAKQDAKQKMQSVSNSFRHMPLTYIYSIAYQTQDERRRWTTER